MKENITNLIELRPITKEDFTNVLEWSRDEYFCEANGWETNRNHDELFNWWLNCVNNDAVNFIRLGIDYENRIVGYTDLVSVSGNSAELGIAIGDSSLWGRGLGYTAALHMIDYGSKELRIDIFYAETHKNNVRSQRLLEKLGFLEIGSDSYEEYPEGQIQVIQYELVL